MFDRIDKDGSGVLDGDELITMADFIEQGPCA